MGVWEVLRNGLEKILETITLVILLKYAALTLVTLCTRQMNFSILNRHELSWNSILTLNLRSLPLLWYGETVKVIVWSPHDVVAEYISYDKETYSMEIKTFL